MLGAYLSKQTNKHHHKGATTKIKKYNHQQTTTKTQHPKNQQFYNYTPNSGSLIVHENDIPSCLKIWKFLLQNSVQKDNYWRKTSHFSEHTRV